MKKVFLVATGIASALLVSCAEPVSEVRIAECKRIAENYSPIESYTSAVYVGTLVELEFVVRSAIKPLRGNASCLYSATSALPVEVIIGKTKHQTAADIESLIQGDYRDGKGFPSHSH